MDMYGLILTTKSEVLASVLVLAEFVCSVLVSVLFLVTSTTSSSAIAERPRCRVG